MPKKIFTGKWMLLLYCAAFLGFPASGFLLIYFLYHTFEYEVLIVGGLVFVFVLVTNSVTGFVKIEEDKIEFTTYLFSRKKTLLLSEIKYFTAKYYKDVFVYAMSENGVEVKIGGGYQIVSVLADLFPEKLKIDWGNYSYRRIPKKQREFLRSKGVFSDEQIGKIEEKSNL